MVCPECKSVNITVVDTIPGDYNEVYRRRRCKDCKQLIFTVEFEVKDNSFFRELYTEACKKKRSCSKGE